MVHGPIMKRKKRKKNLKDIYFGLEVDTDKIKANTQIPVIISTADGKFYISSSTTARNEKIVLINHI